MQAEGGKAAGSDVGNSSRGMRRESVGSTTVLYGGPESSMNLGLGVVSKIKIPVPIPVPLKVFFRYPSCQ